MSHLSQLVEEHRHGVEIVDLAGFVIVLWMGVRLRTLGKLLFIHVLGLSIVWITRIN
jgi:hypothetical protein